MDTTTHGVGDVARLSGTTVRTLHHYEEIGLLTPSRTSAGYRRYDDADLDRLARVLYYRDLGFALDDIVTLLDDATDPVAHLQRQHRLMSARLERVRLMVAAIEKEMEAHMTGTELTAAEKLEIFGDAYDPAHEVEAEERWGDTDAWRQSKERTAHFTKADWQRVKDDGDAFNARLVAAFTAGEEPGGETANRIADEHLASLNVFYDADRAFQRTLADTYVQDERFRSTYDALAPGLAAWLREVIHAAPER